MYIFGIIAIKNLILNPCNFLYSIIYNKRTHYTQGSDTSSAPSLGSLLTFAAIRKKKGQERPILIAFRDCLGLLLRQEPK